MDEGRQNTREIPMVSPLHCSNCQGLEFDQVIEGELRVLRCRSCGHLERFGPVVRAPGSEPLASAPRPGATFTPYPAPADLSVVSLGAVVELSDAGGHLRRTQLVEAGQYLAALRAHPTGNFVTIDSPMGVALAGRQLGDVIHVQLPAGRAIFTIVALSYEASV